jgi:RNA polymerase sigma-70 factor (ECF subfamily)
MANRRELRGSCGRKADKRVSTVERLLTRTTAVALSEIDRNLLARCLAKKPDAWKDFVDRFTGLVIHVIHHSAQSRSLRLTPEDREDLAGEVFFEIVRNDFALLRHFRGESSLATYLTVVARRVVVHELLKRKNLTTLTESAENIAAHQGNGVSAPSEPVQTRDEVERLLAELEGTEAEIVRLYHLEGKSYQEISSKVGMPENSIGPTLSRARQKMRRVGAE